MPCRRLSFLDGRALPEDMSHVGCSACMKIDLAFLGDFRNLSGFHVRVERSGSLRRNVQQWILWKLSPLTFSATFIEAVVQLLSSSGIDELR